MRGLASLQLFGFDAYGDSSAYGPADFHMDAAMKAALKEYSNHGGQLKSGNGWNVQSEATSLERRKMLGPQAADMLSSPSTMAALRAYRNAPTDDARTQQLTEEPAHASVQEQAPSQTKAEEIGWSNQWHPGRMQDSRGSGMSLLQSRATQEALRQLREHAGRQQNVGGRRASSRLTSRQSYAMNLALKDASAQKGSALLATKLTSHAGFTKVQDRGQALEAIKDLLEERLGNVGQQKESRTESLSTAQGLKVERARLEGLMQNMKKAEQDIVAVKSAEHELAGGRGRHAYKTKLEKVKALQKAIIAKENDADQAQQQSRSKSEAAHSKQERALNLDRKEMAAFGKADMSRRSALKFAHKLLSKKAHAKLLKGQIEHERRRADAYEKEGRSLKQLGEQEQNSFEHMAGPVHKAQEQVKLANQAYNAAELKLARAETTAEELSDHPKLRVAAVQKIEQDRKLSSRMETLVAMATRRLSRLEGKDGPLTGLDSHFESPKKRAVRKLAKARQIRRSLDTLKQREQVLEEDVKTELPTLKSDISHAKTLHSEYEKMRSKALAAEKEARKAETVAQSSEQRAQEDQQDANRMRGALREMQSGIGSQLVQEQEADWKRLQDMHQELVTDKEKYENARRRSCAHGGMFKIPQISTSALYTCKATKFLMHFF